MVANHADAVGDGGQLASLGVARANRAGLGIVIAGDVPRRALIAASACSKALEAELSIQIDKAYTELRVEHVCNAKTKKV